MTREQIEARCVGCEHCVAGSGVCMPALQSLMCMLSVVGGRIEHDHRLQRYKGGHYKSIYAVQRCPIRVTAPIKAQHGRMRRPRIQEVQVQQSANEAIEGRFGHLEL